MNEEQAGEKQGKGEEDAPSSEGEVREGGKDVVA